MVFTFFMIMTHCSGSDQGHDRPQGGCAPTECPLRLVHQPATDIYNSSSSPTHVKTVIKDKGIAVFDQNTASTSVGRTMTTNGVAKENVLTFSKRVI